MNENWCALCISILKNVTPEMAFEILDNPKAHEGKSRKYNKTITVNDVADMVKLKEIHTYKEIGEMYGISDIAAYRRIKIYLEKQNRRIN